MISLGYTPYQIRQLINLLYSAHTIRIVVRLMDTSHNYLQDMSNQFVDGQVTFDNEATDSDRALDLTLWDPLRAIHLDPDSPSPSGVFVTNMISIIYIVSNPTGSLIFKVPVFCGPIDDVSRTGNTLVLKCLGKEVLSSDTLWVARSFRPGWTYTALIKNILAEAGETRFNIPDMKAVTKGRVALKRGVHKPFPEAKRIAASQDLQLFYDGRGYATIRPMNKPSSFTWDERCIVADPQFGYDLKTCTNAVEVIGGTPKGRKKPVYYKAVAPDNHPLSPKRVGRNGRPRYLNPIFTNDSTLKTTAQVKARANRLLNDALLEATDATLDILPNPLVELLDIGNIDFDGMSVRHRVRKFTLPLKNTGNSTVGYLRRTKTVGKPPISKRKKKKR